MKKVMMLGAVLWSMMVFPAFADDVTDDIGRATQVYQSGDIKKAMAMLDNVITKMNKKRDGFFLSSFPEPMAGWTASDALVNPMAEAVMGSGSLLTRYYTKATGEKMELRIMSGSNLVRGASGMTNSPLAKLAAAKSEKKKDNIRGFEVKSKFKKGKQRVMLLAGSTMVFALSEDVPEAEMRAYLAKFPLEEF